jgi:low temperature requirement protein LtrA
MPGESVARFKRWFWRPPRAHGEIIPDRAVSSLELFYDLVYVAVIGQAAHHLADDVGVQRVIEFGVVFALIWIAWVTGTLYLELHGREDGRTRSAVFIQMGILALLAVFTAEAAGSSGPRFAVVYGIYLAVQTWLWFSVFRQDRQTRPDYLTLTRRYVLGTGVSAVAILGSATLPAEPRLVVWATFAALWILAIALVGLRARVGLNPGMSPTDSLVERFGTFTLIVLGEVVFGVVEGVSAGEHDATTIATGMIALIVGFGFWWMYFDFVGGRLPRTEGPAIGAWVLGHLPMTLSIAAGGAGTVSLIEHAHDAHPPDATAWLLAGAVALGLLALIPLQNALADARRLPEVYRPLGGALAAGAGTALLVGWLRPAPWVFATLLVAILSALWVYAVSRFIRADAWGEAARG